MTSISTPEISLTPDKPHTKSAENLHSNFDTAPQYVGDRTSNDRWKAITSQNTSSNPDVLQMLEGFELSDGSKPVLLADNNEKLFGSEAHDVIKKAAIEAFQNIKDKVSKLFHPIDNITQGVTSEFHSVLNDPNRNKGEFQWVVGTNKDGKMLSTNTLFTEGLNIGGNEVHISPTKLVSGTGLDVVAVMHTHPFEKGMDGEHFSVPDKEQADQPQRDNPKRALQQVHSCKRKAFGVR